MFAEQRRFGRWSVPEGALGDMYGLTGTEISFGISVQDGDAALIFRQRRNLENRGGYPFTLLFYPRRDIWAQFGWNAPRIALALQATDIGAAMLNDPRNVSEHALARLSEDLLFARSASMIDRTGEPRLTEVIAGSMIAEVVPAVSSAHLGFPTRPTLEDVAVAF